MFSVTDVNATMRPSCGLISPLVSHNELSVWNPSPARTSGAPTTIAVWPFESFSTAVTWVDAADAVDAPGVVVDGAEANCVVVVVEGPDSSEDVVVVLGKLVVAESGGPEVVVAPGAGTVVELDGVVVVVVGMVKLTARCAS